MIFHHVLGVSGCLIGDYAGYGLTSIGALSLMMEMSTIFMNYRSMLSPDNVGKTVTNLNQIVFFLAFTIFRVFLLPYCMYRFYFNVLYSWNYISFSRQCASIWSLFSFFLMTALSFYWYKLIVKGLLKLLGCI
jgi:hypothetical protein